MIAAKAAKVGEDDVRNLREAVSGHGIGTDQPDVAFGVFEIAPDVFHAFSIRLRAPSSVIYQHCGALR